MRLLGLVGRLAIPPAHGRSIRTGAEAVCDLGSSSIRFIRAAVGTRIMRAQELHP